MRLSDFVEAYGYPALFLGTLLEGELILALGGFAAHRGHLDLPLVMLVATAGSALGDQLWFFAGHRWGAPLLSRYPRLSRTVQRAQPRLRRHADVFVLSNRFLVGLRAAGPFAVGLTGISWLRFTVLNLIGATVWSCAIASAGYLIGEGLENLLGDLRRVEEWVFGAVLIAIALLLAVRHLLRPHRG